MNLNFIWATCLFLGLSLFFTTPLFSTTIAPYPNLGEMAKGSDAVVLARATKNLSLRSGQQTNFRTNLVVLQAIKGRLFPGQTITLQDYHTIVGTDETEVWGDAEFEEGKTYLVFLGQTNDGLFRPLMLSYGIFEEVQKAGHAYLAPIAKSKDLHIYDYDGQLEYQPLKVYHKSALVEMLTGYVDQKINWKEQDVASDFPAFAFAESRAAPAHCTFLNGSATAGSPSARWEDFPGTVLPVLYAVGGDSGCPGAFGIVSGAVTTLNTNYGGIDMTDGGTHVFVPASGCTDAKDGVFTAHVDSAGLTRSVFVQFDDPCSQIPDLSGCSGTLAIGGSYRTGATTHTHDGIGWQSARRGYVIVNNGTGTCRCASGYDRMIEHEVTHALRIGHIAAASGMANMNPSCCNAIAALDIQCLDYTYPIPLPVELMEFKGQLESKQVVLNWKTALEINNDYFILSKSTDGQHFEELNYIESFETNSFIESDYQFIDDSPVVGVNYYQLSQVDLDGTRHDLGIVTVDYFNQLDLQLNPNPLLGDELNVSVGTDFSGQLKIEVYDLLGQLIHQDFRRKTRGLDQWQIQLADLTAGLYILHVEQNGIRTAHKFVKK